LITPNERERERERVPEGISRIEHARIALRRTAHFNI
jgi:hypothetical protein